MSDSRGLGYAVYSQCRKLIGPTRLGMLDYLLDRKSKDPWGGPFNGQKARQDLFRHLLQACRPAAIIETGTYLGSSTQFMAESSGLPIYSVDDNARIYGFAKMRLRKYANVKLSLGDSREFIKKFIGAEASKYAGHPLLFYLDAHWGEDLPLFEEVAKIFSSPSQAIVMVDDFQVPDDDGYTYDDYGKGKALTREYIAPAVSQFQLVEFYPTIPSVAESGLRRGCVVVARDPSLVEALSRISLLRRWELHEIHVA
jgi:predicted O-methyltransferase YrrM